MFRSQKTNQFKIQKEQEKRKLVIEAGINKLENEEKYFKNQQSQNCFP